MKTDDWANLSESIDGIARNLTSPNEHDSNLEAANVVDGLFAIARGLESVAKAIQDLGNGNASTPMGAMELFGKTVRDELNSISVSIGSGLTEIAEALAPKEDS